jgi:hypothetical protein
MKKRAAAAMEVILFAAFSLVFAALVVFGQFHVVTNILDASALEKNYLARDIALVLDAVYAAPGEVTYSYELTGKFCVDVENSRVYVRKRARNGLECADEKRSEQTSYRFAAVDGVSSPSFEMQQGSLEPMFLKISKNAEGVVAVEDTNG